jgi:SAM-dependent methyltransferase
MNSATAEKVGFDPTHFARLARAEAGNFWFRARNKLILWSIAKFAPGARNFLEVGCGTGFVLQAIAARFPTMALAGSELFAEGLPFAAERIPQARLRTLDAKQIDIENEFDAIGAFDVIEHIDDDVLVLSNLHKALTPGGHLFINVPQHQFLWSQSDDIACHCRRYERPELVKKLQHAGFTIELTTSFVALLLPMMLASRWWSNNVDRSQSVLSELEMRGPLNFLLEQILNVELTLVHLGIRWPMGGSLYVVARKQGDSP